MEPSSTNLLSNEIYVRTQRYLTLENVIKLYTWKYFNEQDSVPNELLQAFLDAKLFNEIDGNLIKLNARMIPIGETNTEENEKEKADVIPVDNGGDDDDDEEAKTTMNAVDGSNSPVNTTIDLEKEKEKVEETNNTNQEDHVVNKKNEAETVLKGTSLKIDNTHTIQRVFWTAFQRDAARNTRDHYIRGYPKSYPMIADLPFTKGDNKLRFDFFLGLLKADVSSRILCQICLASVQQAIELFEDIEIDHGFYDGDDDVEDHSGINVLLEPSEKTVIEKEKRLSSAQRTSITNFDPVQRDIDAAIKIQRFYLMRLKRLKFAVHKIEMWWEPTRRQGTGIRRVSQTEVVSVVGIATTGDLLQYVNYLDEIKNDYKQSFQQVKFRCNPRRNDDGNDIDNNNNDNDENTLLTVPRTFKYWLEVFLIAFLCTISSFLLNLFTFKTINPDEESMTFLIGGIFIFQSLTFCRLNTKVLWVQTIVLFILVSMYFNANDFGLYNLTTKGYGITGFRILILLILFRLSKNYWLITFVLLTILIYIIFFDILIQNAFSNLLYTVHDLYTLSTISGASTHGRPIQMFHKILTNWVLLIIATFVTTISTCFGGANCFGNSNNGPDDGLDIV
jgi:hypothetical protein